MRYITICWLVAGLLFTVVSCTQEEKEEEDVSPKSYTIGVLVTGKPFAFLDEDGQLNGLEPELMRRIAKDEELTLTLQPVESIEELQAGIADGTYGGGIGRLVREELPVESTILYSDPYLSMYLTVLVPVDTDLEKLGDLEGRRVGVQQGTRADEVLSAREDVFVRRYERGSQAVEALLNGDLDAVVMGNRAAEVFLTRYEDKLDELADTLAMVNYALLTKRSEFSLNWAFNGQLLRLRGIGFITDLRKKYDQDFLEEAQ